MTIWRQLPLPAISFAVGAIALGRALQINNGFYSPEGLSWLVAAFTFVAAATLMQRFTPERLTCDGARIVNTLLLFGIGWQLVSLATTAPGFYTVREANRFYFFALLAVQAAAIAVGAAQAVRFRLPWFPIVLAASVGLGVWIIKASPNPYIDVVAVHKEALDALLRGRDPYVISFPNIYSPELARVFYNPEAVAGDRILFSYPYPPASLILVVPGHWLFGEYRYSELALLVAGAALIGWTRPSLTAKLAACLLLTTPRVWFVIEQGWTEPVGIFLLALTVFLLSRSSIPAGVAAGLLVVAKQYLGFIGPGVVRLAFFRPRQWRWTTVAGVTAAAAVTLPIALKHPSAFMRNVVWLQTLEPFRMDSLSFVSWAAHAGLGQASYRWAVGAALVAALICLATTRNSDIGFAASVSLTTFALFVFGSKAFCNYYFFVIGAVCATLAAYPVETRASAAVATHAT